MQQAIIPAITGPTNQSNNQPISEHNQLNNLTNNQSNISTTNPKCQSIKKRTINQTINRPIDQTSKQSIGESIHKPINR